MQEPKHFPVRRLNRDAPGNQLLTERIRGCPFVYRIYDADRQPLYIGMTHTADVRLATHRNRSKWWPLAEYIAISSYPTWAATQEAERAAIRAERPRCNKAGMAWRKQVVLRLDTAPEDIARELHDIGRPEFIQELADLLAHPERFNFPEAPPPPDFQEAATH